MPGVKQSRDDSDNEESDSEHSSEVDFILSDHSDSEESSELDEQECNEQQLVFSSDVGDLEKQFSMLKEQLFSDRLCQVGVRLSTVLNGEAAEFITPLNHLQDSYTVRLEVAGVAKRFRLKNIQTKHDAERVSASQNHENEKVLMLCSLQDDVQEKICVLQEDRTNVSFTCQVRAEQNLCRSPRSAIKQESPDGRPLQTVMIEGPYIVYRLREEEIMEDWTIIRRAIQASKQRKGKGQFSHAQYSLMEMV